MRGSWRVSPKAGRFEESVYGFLALILQFYVFRASIFDLRQAVYSIWKMLVTVEPCYGGRKPSFTYRFTAASLF